MAIHTVSKLLNHRNSASGRKEAEIGGLIIENTFASVAETASYLITGRDWLKWIVYPFVIDKFKIQNVQSVAKIYNV